MTPYEAVDHYIPTMQGWSSPAKCKRLLQAVIETAAQVSVDLGAYGGKGAISMAFGHREQNFGVVHAVDAWDSEVALLSCTSPTNRAWWLDMGRPLTKAELAAYGWPNMPVNSTKFDCIYEGFLAAIRGHHVEAYVSVHKLESAEAAKLIADGSVGVLHLDGNHSEAGSVRDVELWAPKIKPGGYIFFDDTDWFEIPGVPSTTKAQQMLLDGGFKLTHVEPSVPGHWTEWRVFQKSGTPVKSMPLSSVPAMCSFLDPVTGEVMDTIPVIVCNEESACADNGGMVGGGEDGQ